MYRLAKNRISGIRTACCGVKKQKKQTKNRKTSRLVIRNLIYTQSFHDFHLCDDNTNLLLTWIGEESNECSIDHFYFHEEGILVGSVVSFRQRALFTVSFRESFSLNVYIDWRMANVLELSGTITHDDASQFSLLKTWCQPLSAGVTIDFRLKQGQSDRTLFFFTWYFRFSSLPYRMTV